MERAEAQRLQPHHVQSFFVEAFQKLGGRIKRREEGRWEITHVPVSIRERDRLIGVAAPLQKKYERICFEKGRINTQPVAEFICPGHPLLEAVISLLREQYEHLMKQGAVLVDETDESQDVSAIFLLEHTVQDGCTRPNGQPHIISQKLQFAAIGKDGAVSDAGIAPHLNLRPATSEEIELTRDRLEEDWLTRDLERTAVEFATVELAQKHVSDVKARRLPEIDKVEQEVRARLSQEINYWDGRALVLREEENAGRKTRLNWQNAQRRAEELSERLKRRTEQLQAERHITARPPRVRGGMVVIPRGLLRERMPAAEDQEGFPPEFAEDPVARREIELAAMNAVMEMERALGNTPTDVSAQKVGYDVASYDAESGHLRFIEVKGRVQGADNVMITRQELITSLHEPGKFILAVVEVDGGYAGQPRYRFGALDTREPPFDQEAIRFNLKSLLEKAEAPR